MILNNNDYVNNKDFLALDYPCASTFGGFTYSNLEQAIIAVLCEDTAIWQIISSTDDNADARTMLPEIIDKRVSHQDYVERLILIVTEKFSQQDMFDKLCFETSDDDVFTYQFPTNGSLWQCAQFMQPYYDIIGKILTLFRRGTTSGLLISEEILGEF